MKRFRSATWNGGLREGRGSVSTESHALETYPNTFFSRYVEKLGANPEELLGAAHAACFHHVVRQIPRHGELRARASRQQIGSRHRKGGDGFSITSVHLTATAKIPGIDQATFESIAASAKVGCPVSKLMKVEIAFETTLPS
jgi:osmotically inducible protein OsmC